MLKIFLVFVIDYKQREGTMPASPLLMVNWNFSFKSGFEKRAPKSINELLKIFPRSLSNIRASIGKSQDVKILERTGEQDAMPEMAWCTASTDPCTIDPASLLVGVWSATVVPMMDTSAS